MITSLTLRCAIAIFLSLLLHLGLLAQMVRAEEHEPTPVRDACCAHEEVSHNDAPPGCPEDADCPLEGDHCHHHGTCSIHGIFLLYPPEKSPSPSAPEAQELAFELLEFWAGDGPVMKLDKPPLI